MRVKKEKRLLDRQSLDNLFNKLMTNSTSIQLRRKKREQIYYSFPAFNSFYNLILTDYFSIYVRRVSGTKNDDYVFQFCMNPFNLDKYKITYRCSEKTFNHSLEFSERVSALGTLFFKVLDPAKDNSVPHIIFE